MLEGYSFSENYFDYGERFFTENFISYLKGFFVVELCFHTVLLWDHRRDDWIASPRYFFVIHVEG